MLGGTNNSTMYRPTANEDDFITLVEISAWPRSMKLCSETLITAITTPI